MNEALLRKLTEAAIELADGQSIRDFLRALTKAAVARVVPLLPPVVASAEDDGRLPYQNVDLCDATSQQVIVRACRYSGTEDQRFERSYAVPYTSAGGMITMGDPVEVEARVVYVAVGADVGQAMGESATPEQVAAVRTSLRRRVEVDAERLAKSGRLTEACAATLRTAVAALRGAEIEAAGQALAKGEPGSVALAEALIGDYFGRGASVAALATRLTEAKIGASLG